jgi:hypothetical protein
LLRRVESRRAVAGPAEQVALEEARQTLIRLRFGDARHWPEPRRAFRSARRAMRRARYS